MIGLAVPSSLGISDSSRRDLSTFVELFEKWNLSINLSAARTRADVIEHVVDSCHVIPHLRGAQRVLDVGSGGGFPAVVAAICLPEIAFTSLEPVHKKHAFLKTAARELSLANLTALSERLEDHATRDYDVAMSRATFDLADWLTTGATYVRPSGVIIGFEAVTRSDLQNVERLPYQLGNKHRALVLVRAPA